MSSPEDKGDERSEPELSESLAGLVGAFDKLKETMGYEGGDDEIERFVNNIQMENNKLRQHAEDAIMVRCFRIVIIIIYWVTVESY